jgi:hypothetical protein
MSRSQTVLVTDRQRSWLLRRLGTMSSSLLLALIAVGVPASLAVPASARASVSLPPISIQSVSPGSAAAFSFVTITGRNFSPYSAVYFGVELNASGGGESFPGVGSFQVDYISSTTLRAEVPEGAIPGPGYIKVVSSVDPIGGGVGQDAYSPTEFDVLETPICTVNFQDSSAWDLNLIQATATDDTFNREQSNPTARDWASPTAPLYLDVHGNVATNDRVLDTGLHKDLPEDRRAALLSGPSHGNVTLNADGSFDYVPFDGYLGGDSFRYVAYGDVNTSYTGCSDPATVTIIPSRQIRPVPDGYSVTENGTLLDATIQGLLFNDVNVSLSSGAVLPPTALDPLPTFSSSPFYIDSEPNDPYIDLDFGGIFPGNQFHLVWDGDPTSTITYSPDMRHDITVALDALPGNLNGNVEVRKVSDSIYRVALVRALRASSQPTVSIVKESSDLDFPGPVNVSSGAEHLWVTRNGYMTSFDNGQFVYSPDDGFLGVDGFSYQANNTNAADRIFPGVDVRIAVVEPTIAKPHDDSFSIVQDHSLAITPGDLLGNDDNAFSVACVGEAFFTCFPNTLRTNFGTLALTWESFGIPQLTGAVYTPDAGASGIDSFTYNNGYLGGDHLPHIQVDYTATVFIDVSDTPDHPIANAISESTQAGTAITVDVASRDSDPDGDLDASSLQRDSLPCDDQPTSLPGCVPTDWTSQMHGTWHPNGDGTVTYTPNAGFSGIATWPYRILDTTNLDAFSTVSVRVTSGADDTYATPENRQLNVSAPTGVLANDSAPTSATLATGTHHGQVQLNSDGSFTYTPDAFFTGTDSFTYGSGSDGAKATITVTPVNQAPSVYLNPWCDPSDNSRVCANTDDTRDILEGGSVQLNGSISDRELDSGTLVIDWRDGSQTTADYPCAPSGPCAFTTNPTYTSSCDGYCVAPLFFHFAHTYLDNPPAGDHYQIIVTATEGDGTDGGRVTAAKVSNVAPSVTLEPDCGLCFNPPGSTLTSTTVDPVQLSGQVTDPGADRGTATIDWGDGSTATMVPFDCAIAGELCPTPAQQSPFCGLLNSGLSCGYFFEPHTYASGGTFTISVTATDKDGGSSTATTNATISGPVHAAPAITSAASTTFTVGSAGSFTVTTTGSPAAALSKTGTLPSLVTFVDNGDGTATLSGTPAGGTGGDYPITITANNGVSPNATQTFTLHVHAAPAITSAASTTFTVGSSGSFTVTTSGSPAAALSQTGALPSGVTFTDNGNGTATLSGAPDAGTSGPYPLTITAANGVAPNAGQSFTLTVNSNAQSISFGTLGGKTYGNAAFTVSATATSGLAVAFTASPAGVCTSGGTNGATITITGVGTCTVTAHQAGNGTWQAAQDVSQSFVVGAKPVTVQVTPASVQYSDPVPNLNIVGSVPGLVGSDTLSGSLSGCTASGLTVSGGMVQSPAGNYPLTGCAGLSNPNYTVSYSGSVTVSKESATAAYSGPSYASTGSATATKANVTLTGQITQDADGHLGDLTKATAQFLLYNSGNLSMTTPDLIVSGTVSAAGAVTGTAANLAVDTYTVILRVNPANTFYGGPEADPDLLTVFTPATDTWVTGGGWVIDPSTGNKPVAVDPKHQQGHFGFTVSYSKKGSTTPKGHAAYTFHGADGYVYIIKSSSWQGGALALNGAHAAYFTGKAVVVAINPVTGQPVSGIGGGNFSFRVDIVDGGSNGTNDTYALSVFTSGNALYHQVGTPASPLHLQKGDIAVQAR